MILRAILAFLALPTMVAGVFPWLIAKLPAHANFQWPYGTVLIVPGSLILLASVVSFYRHGRGTLAPWDPPKHLVVQDLYRFNRNPMYVGVELLTLGWALGTGNPWNYAYSLLVLIIFHLRVVLYEEKEMKRLFGHEWVAYCSKVPRWGWTLRPYPRMKNRIAERAGPHGSSPMKKLLIIAGIALLLWAGFAAVAFFEPPALQSSDRRAWKEKNIAAIAERLADPLWLNNELGRLKTRSTAESNPTAGWLSEHLILTRTGEWLAYANICRKQDRRVHDLFVARGSDGRWYYSTYHFCIGMMALRTGPQPKDLATFSKTYFVQGFDGQSDDCLRMTWAPTDK